MQCFVYILISYDPYKRTCKIVPGKHGEWYEVPRWIKYLQKIEIAGNSATQHFSLSTRTVHSETHTQTWTFCCHFASVALDLQSPHVLCHSQWTYPLGTTCWLQALTVNNKSRLSSRVRRMVPVVSSHIRQTTQELDGHITRYNSL